MHLPRMQFCLILGLLFSIGGASAAADYPALEMNGLQFPNACSKPEQAKLRKAVSGQAKDAPSAWRAVNAILCAPRTGPERTYLASLFPIKLREELDDTGDEPRYKTIRRSDEVIDRAMAAGEAWDAELTAAPEEVTIQYFANEACVKSVTLLYGKAKWKVDVIREACD